MITGLDKWTPALLRWSFILVTVTSDTKAVFIQTETGKRQIKEFNCMSEAVILLTFTPLPHDLEQGWAILVQKGHSSADLDQVCSQSK